MITYFRGQRLIVVTHLCYMEVKQLRCTHCRLIEFCLLLARASFYDQVTSIDNCA